MATDDYAESMLGELTLYEREAAPLTVRAGMVISLLTPRLNKNLSCAICLGVLRETVAVKDCMHRFCSDCITKSLRVGNRECPTCRAKCASRRSLRRDEAMDKLIETLYPSQKVRDKAEELQIDTEQIETLRDNIAAVAERQAELRAKHKTRAPTIRRSRKRKINKDEIDPRDYGSARRLTSRSTATASRGARSSSDCSADTKEPPSKRQRWSYGKPLSRSKRSAISDDDDDLSSSEASRLPTPEPIVVHRKYQSGMAMTFVLEPHDKEIHLRSLEKSVVTTSVDASVEHVRRFLALKLRGRNRSLYKLSIDVAGEPVVVPQAVSLLEVYESYWNRPKEMMILHYSLRNTTLEDQ